MFQNSSEYRIVFLITCGIYLFGAVFYGIFASGDIQPWALTESVEKIHLEEIENILEDKSQKNKHMNSVEEFN